MDSVLTIGMVAKQAGIRVDTIRFYERKGLIKPPPRNDAGYRIYTPEYVERIRLIKFCRALGFSLQEIGDLMGLVFQANRACAEIHQQLRVKIHEVESRLEGMLEAKEKLEALIESCNGEHCDDCVVINCSMGG